MHGLEQWIGVAEALAGLRMDLESCKKLTTISDARAWKPELLLGARALTASGVSGRGLKSPEMKGLWEVSGREFWEVFGRPLGAWEAPGRPLGGVWDTPGGPPEVVPFLVWHGQKPPPPGGLTPR